MLFCKLLIFTLNANYATYNSMVIPYSTDLEKLFCVKTGITDNVEHFLKMDSPSCNLQEKTFWQGIHWEAWFGNVLKFRASCGHFFWSCEINGGCEEV